MIYNVTLEQIDTGFKQVEVTLGINDDNYDATITLKNLDSSAKVVNTISSEYNKTKINGAFGIPEELQIKPKPKRKTAAKKTTKKSSK